MSIVVTKYVDNIAIVKMANGVTNPISLDLVNEMSESLAKITAKARGMALIICKGISNNGSPAGYFDNGSSIEKHHGCLSGGHCCFRS